MAKFNQVVLQAVENGFTVSVTKLELTERGYQPSEAHFIASTLEDAIVIVKEGGPPSKVKLV